MRGMMRWVVVCGFLLVALLVLQGCQAGQSANARVSAPVTSLGGSDGFVLVQHPNGELYVINLVNQNAYKVAGLPRSAD